MAVTADRVIVELEAKLDRYEAGVRRAEQKFDSATRAIEADSKRMARTVSANSDAVGSRFRALAVTIGAAFSVRQIQQYADGYTRFINQLRVAGVEGSNLAVVQERLLAIGNAYGQDLESVGTLFSRASQAGKELGATQEDLFKLTEATAAALKIQGTSAVEAQGALLQLGQALGAGTVRAEEFNSINEGARPLLAAVAQQIDRYGGSVARLRADVIEGKVSSQEFFRALVDGQAALSEQADKAQLTIGASFTVLNNALGVFIGQTDASLSATERISAAIIGLSENLDTVATAIGLISAVMLGRFVGGMAAGGLALRAISAYASIATTSLAGTALAGRAAGAALLTAFGGPVGLAVAALTVGLGYLAVNEAETAAASASLTASIEEQAAALGNVAAENARADAATGRLDATQRAALAGVARLTGETDLLAQSWGRVAAEAKRAALEQARATFVTAQSNRMQAEAAVTNRAAATAARPSNDPSGSFTGVIGRGTRSLLNLVSPGNSQAAATEARTEQLRLQTARQNERLAARALLDVRNQQLSGFTPDPVSPAGGGDATGARTGGGSTPSGAAARFAEDLERGRLEIASAMADAVGTVEARRNVELARIDYEREATARAIEADDSYSAAQREQLLAVNDEVAAARRSVLAAEARAETTEDLLNTELSALDDQRADLQARGQLAETAAERRDVELRLLDLQYREERLRLRAIADDERRGAAERAAARATLGGLDGRQAIEAEGVRRDTMGPLESYMRRFNPTAAESAELAEKWTVDTLESVQDRITGALQKAIGVKDPILGGIIEMFVQQVIMKPIADALAAQQGGGSGGFFSTLFTAASTALGAPPARASGGHVSAGKLYGVNERGVEGFQPAGSGKIIPLGRMRGSGGGGGVRIMQTVNVDASGSVNPEGYADQIVRRVRRETAEIVGEGMKRVSQSVPARAAQYERDGT